MALVKKDLEQIRDMLTESLSAIRRMEELVAELKPVQPNTDWKPGEPLKEMRLFEAHDVSVFLHKLASFKKATVDGVLHGAGYNGVEPFVWDVAFQHHYAQKPITEKQVNAVLRVINKEKYAPVREFFLTNEVPS